MASNEEKFGQPGMDRWLDAALRARLGAEPRAGLEERVLARIASRPARAQFQWWSAVSAAATILFFAAALLMWMTSKPRSNVAAGQQPENHSAAPVARQ